MGKSGFLTARRFLVDDAGASGVHERGLSSDQGRLGGSLVAACDSIFDPAQRRAHARAAGFIHFSAARDLARGLLGRFGVGHRSVLGFASVMLMARRYRPRKKAAARSPPELRRL